MTFRVRNAALEDEAVVIALWDACGLLVSYNDPGSDFRFAATGASSAVLVAEDSHGRIIGSVMVGHDGHRGWLYYVATAAEHRGQGIGRALVQAGEQWLHDRSVPKVQLMVRPTNTAVVTFYERLGYEDMPRVLMSKWLNRHP
jgi:ribosomal protein S18 acetylase RimI-like enzyme